MPLKDTAHIWQRSLEDSSRCRLFPVVPYFYAKSLNGKTKKLMLHCLKTIGKISILKASLINAITFLTTTTALMYLYLDPLCGGRGHNPGGKSIPNDPSSMSKEVTKEKLFKKSYYYSPGFYESLFKKSYYYNPGFNDLFKKSYYHSPGFN